MAVIELNTELLPLVFCVAPAPTVIVNAEFTATAKDAAVNRPPAPPPPPPPCAEVKLPPPPPPATTKYSTSVGFLPSALIDAVTRPPRYLLIVLECY
jgi:hypothetical protein